MAMRKRFKPLERAAFLVGTRIEWLDVTRWRSGVVTGEIQTINGYQEIPIRDTGPSTKTIATGGTRRISAGHVRLPVVVAVDPGRITGLAIRPAVE
jgi:predicted RNase H-like nuclease (RuvC/YqgF family)